MSNNEIIPHLRTSWLELPLLVDRFVQRVAPATRCPRLRLRERISDDLGLAEYESISQVCRTISDVYGLLIDFYNDVVVEDELFDTELVGLASAVVHAWHEADKEIGGLEGIDLSAIEPARRLPWRIWATWGRSDDGAEASDAAASDEESKEQAFGILEEFIDSCRSWRDEVLSSYTLVHHGTPVGRRAVDAALNVASLVRPTEKLDNTIEDALRARGFSALHAGGGWVQYLESGDARQPPVSERSAKRLKLLIDQVEIGQSIVQVRELREVFQWLQLDYVDVAYEDGPCMWEALAHLSADTFLQVAPHQSPEEISTLVPWSTVYVASEAEIAAALRCSGKGAEGIWVVSREEALAKGTPQIAGWFAVKWWD